MSMIVKLPVEVPDRILDALAELVAKKMAGDERYIVDIVRCKDCKYRNRAFTCMFHGKPLNGNDFCSKGVRRDDE